MLKKVIRKFWNRSVLNALIHDIDSPHIDVSRMILFGTDNAEEVLKFMNGMEIEEVMKNE